MNRSLRIKLAALVLLTPFSAWSFTFGDAITSGSPWTAANAAQIQTRLDAMDDCSSTQVLVGNGANTPPLCSTVSLVTMVTGLLPLTNFANGAALSVLGRASNSSGGHASIGAASDHQVLRRSGTSLGFGAVALNQANAVTGALPVANGGTGSATAADARTALAVPQLVASGTLSLGTGNVTSESCTTALTATATGAASTDVVAWSANGDWTAITGYASVSAGSLTIYVYPTANTVNAKVCNPTGSTIDRGAATINWRVIR